VLRALGAAEDMAHSSLRFGIGRFTTEAEVDYVVNKIVATVNKLREMRFAVLAVIYSILN
jgi:cysteine desulfurase